MASLTMDQILTLNCNQLRAECTKAGLDTKGKKAELQERLRRHIKHQNNNENGKGNEPARVPKKCPSPDLICPITQELPFEPVTAEDLRVYERAAIEKHIKTQKDANQILKSPMTGLAMGDRLLPAPQHKNVIESLIESGVLKGDLVSTWNEKVNEKKAMEDLIKKADNGGVVAMLIVATNYNKGENGFKQDLGLAFFYYNKGYRTGHPCCTAMLGGCFLGGVGVEQSHARGWFLVTLAAGKGSKMAWWMLGRFLAAGQFGMAVDKEEAILCLKKVVEGNCAIADLSDKGVEEAQELLDELTGATDN